MGNAQCVMSRITRYSLRITLGLLFCLLLSLPCLAFSFAVFGDNQGNSEAFDLLLGKLGKDKALSFVVNVGDFTVYGKEAEYTAYKKKIAQLKIPVYNVLGNHDGIYGGWRIFQKYFGPLYYSFDYENSHFVILNNAFKESFDREEFDWLKKDLAASRARHKFVFMHKPTFDPSEIYKDYVMSGREVTQELVKLFEKYKVDYVLAGHIHGYAKAGRGGVTYIVTAGAGAHLYLPPEFGGFYHYVIITVDGGRIEDRTVRIYE
ncbi:MAG: metallophosphoesterase [Candidatus Omnitrophica bacterium]|nr:metallophosphoesterase [Candidatus Omnitrophota bacterium]